MATFILLIVFFKISIHYNNPLVLAACYTFLTALINGVLTQDFFFTAAAAVATFDVMWLLFYLLDRFEDSALWWLFAFLFAPAVLLVNSAF